MAAAAGKRRTRKKTTLFPGPNQCHPRVGKVRPQGGCLPVSVLERSARALGIRGRTIGNSPQSLLHRISDSIKVDAKNQRSFLMALPLSQDEKTALAAKWLRPAMPPAWKDDPDMWLDSNNIRDVMAQYQEAKSNFLFLGPYPIDFAAKDPYVKGEERCMIGEMCELDLDGPKLRGKKYIGIVYNLDPHYKNGSHWVATFINIPAKTCYYFDSYGMRPPQPIYRFMQWLGIQEPEICLGWNGRQLQFSDSECGMFSMYFIDCMLAGEAFQDFCRRAASDNFMLDMRDWMFST